GFEQRAADFTQRKVDVGFTQRAAAREAVEDATKFFRQVIEHRSANTFAPEGASRCRAVASGLFWTGRRSRISRLYRERAEPRVAASSSQGEADLGRQFIADAYDSPQRLFARRNRNCARADGLHRPRLRGSAFFADRNHLSEFGSSSLGVKFGLATCVGDGFVAGLVE